MIVISCGYCGGNVFRIEIVRKEGHKAARGWNEFLPYGNRQRPQVSYDGQEAPSSPCLSCSPLQHSTFGPFMPTFLLSYEESLSA
jgi:hypothetical protein